MKIFKTNWFILAALLIAVAVVAAFTFKRKSGPEYFTAKVEQGDIREVVDATGTINAVTTVQVGSQVSGMISHLYADFNSHVKKGQLVAQIEPTLFQGALLQAKADLENAKANLAAAKANLIKSQASQQQAKADYLRIAGLAKEGVMSQQQLDLARATSEQADAAVSAGDASVTQSAAQVKQREAAVAVAQRNFDLTHIYAPIDGVVTNRQVDVGQTVAASLQAPTLFTIAQDLTKMQVYAKTDESDVGQIHAGQKITFKVDAFPRETFEGTVAQVRMNATTVQNVVTYDTIINFDNPELKLFPGMTAYVTIPVAQAQDVLKIPNGALRYKPDMKTDEIKALYAKYGFDQTPQAGGRRDGGRSAGQGGDSAHQKPGDRATVWKLRADKTLEPVRIRTGITDHTVTEVVQVLKGAIKPGEELVIGTATPTAAGAGNRPPGMGGPGGPGGMGRMR